MNSIVRKTSAITAGLLLMALASCNNPTGPRFTAEPSTGIKSDTSTGLIAGLDMEGDAILSNPDAFVSSTVSWEAGLSGNAMRGDEDGDFVRITDGAFPETPFTGSIEVWIFPEHSSNDNRSGGILHKGDETDFSDEAWSLQNWQTEEIVFLYSPASNPDTYKMVKADRRISVEKWHHLAATWSCDTESGDVELKLYIDGALNQSRTFKGIGPMVDSEGDVLIGSQLPEPHTTSSFGHMTFQGLIDEISIYSYARSAEEILADYQIYVP